jgi:hypothetical protein
MPDVDLATWPLVTVRLDAPGDPAEQAVVVGVVASAVEREQPFGLIVLTPAPLVLPQGRSDVPLSCLRRWRARVGSWCRGLCYVLPPAELARFDRHRRAEAGRLWGCRVNAAPDEAAAARWLDPHLGNLNPRPPEA